MHDDISERRSQFGRGTLTLTLAGLAVILLVFTLQMLASMRADIARLPNELATKQELANLAARLGPDPAADVLEGRCTDCHTRETFMEAHGVTEEVDDLVARMSALMGASIPADERRRVEAALTFIKCAHCHTVDRLNEIAILDPAERWNIIVTMMQEPGATITQEDAERIRDFYGDFWGWHRR